MSRNFIDHPLLLIVLVLIVVLVFGANKLPGAARSLGRSMRIFKSEIREMKDDDERPAADAEEPPLHGRVIEHGQARGADDGFEARRRSPDTERSDS
ncbi:MAG: Sec-independent protein translocase subunit TatA [Actinomycetes bacterium]